MLVDAIQEYCFITIDEVQVTDERIDTKLARIDERTVPELFLKVSEDAGVYTFVNVYVVAGATEKRSSSVFIPRGGIRKRATGQRAVVKDG